MGSPLTPEHYSAEQVVQLLGLEPLDREGGFFRRVGESLLMLPGTALPAAIGGDRRAWSCIYMLLTPGGFSALHRLAIEEIWFLVAGDPLESLRLASDGSGGWVRLGASPGNGLRLHDVVAAQTWQGTKLAAGGRWGLAALVVVPEFTWQDFELGERTALTAAYPAFAADIAGLTRGQPPAGSR